MWTDDAFREVENRVLQRQQPHRRLSARAVYLSGLYLPASGGAQQPLPPAIYQFPPGGKQRCAKTDETDGAGMAYTPAHLSDVGCSGEAVQPDHTRMVELLRGILSAL